MPSLPLPACRPCVGHIVDEARARAACRTPSPGPAGARAAASMRTAHARLHRPPPLPVHPGDARGRVHRVLAVQLRRRSGQQHGRHRGDHRGARADGRGARAERPVPDPVRPVRRQRAQGGFRPVVPAVGTGGGGDRGASARDARARVRRRGAGARARGAARGLHRAAPRGGGLAHTAHDLARGHLAPDLPNRHPPDPGLLGVAQLAPVVRARGDGGHRMGEQPGVLGGVQVHHPAVGHAVPVPAHAAHAARARGDAGGAAHRLRQVRAGRGA